MKTHVKYLLVLLACLSAAAPAAFAQEAARLKLSGLEKLAAKASEVVDVNLDGSMLQLASRFMNNDDKDSAHTKQMLEKMKGIYVKSFEFDKPGEYSPADVEAIRRQLRGPGWSRIVTVRGKNKDNADIYVMGAGTGSQVQGLAIIVAEPKELTVVNLVGPVDLNQLSDLGGHLGVPKLPVQGKLKKQPENKKHAPN